MDVKRKRIGAGAYEYSKGDLRVEVIYNELCGGWIAAALYTSDVYTDPLPTKADAKRNALAMLEPTFWAHPDYKEPSNG